MKYAIATIAYNESEIIEACIRNWKGLVDKHLILVSSKPWNGKAVPNDGTAEIAKRAGAEVVVGDWDTEAQQRNEGLAILHDYDYVLIVDPDELYTKKTQKAIFEALDNPMDPNWRTDKKIPSFRIQHIRTYWKSPKYVLAPEDRHKPVIAVDPKQLFCHEHRQFGGDYVPLIPGTCHHFSWVKSDEKVKEKIQSYSHSSAIVLNWYEDIWLKWRPGCDFQVKPYFTEKDKATAIYSPAPKEILELLSVT